jgi:ribosomal protein L40E
MVHWMIQGDVDFGFGIVSIVVAGLLGAVMLNPPNGLTWISPLIAVALAFSVFAFVPLRQALEGRELVAIELDQLDRAYKQLDERPGNLGARFKIAKLVHRRGFYGHAMAIAEDALKQMPEEFFQEEHKVVATWKRTELEPGDLRGLGCVECGFSNPPGEIYCKRCGSKYLLDQAKGKWIGRTLGRKILASWVALMGVFVGIPITALALPLVPAIIGVLGISILILTILYTAFLGEKGIQA